MPGAVLSISVTSADGLHTEDLLVKINSVGTVDNDGTSSGAEADTGGEGVDDASEPKQLLKLVVVDAPVSGSSVQPELSKESRAKNANSGFTGFGAPKMPASFKSTSRSGQRGPETADPQKHRLTLEKVFAMQRKKAAASLTAIEDRSGTVAVGTAPPPPANESGFCFGTKGGMSLGGATTQQPATSSGFSFGDGASTSSKGNIEFGFGGAQPGASKGGFSVGDDAPTSSAGQSEFVFGGAAVQPGASEGGFGFGEAPSSDEGELGFGGAAAQPDGSKGDLHFGADASASPSDEGGFGFGGAAATPEGGFSFGAGASISSSGKGGFGFGGAAAKPTATNDDFSFGGGASTSHSGEGGFGFGGAAAKPAASKGGFSFGGGASTSSATKSDTVCAPAASKSAGFAFSDSASSSGGGFSFGSTAATTANSTATNGTPNAPSTYEIVVDAQDFRVVDMAGQANFGFEVKETAPSDDDGLEEAVWMIKRFGKDNVWVQLPASINDNLEEAYVVIM